MDAPGADASDGGCSTTEQGVGMGGMLNWPKRFGDTGGTTATAIVLDPTNGDLVMIGYSSGSTNFGGGDVTEGDAGGGGFVTRTTTLIPDVANKSPRIMRATAIIRGTGAAVSIF